MEKANIFGPMAITMTETIPMEKNMALEYMSILMAPGMKATGRRANDMARVSYSLPMADVSNHISLMDHPSRIYRRPMDDYLSVYVVAIIIKVLVFSIGSSVTFLRPTRFVVPGTSNFESLLSPPKSN